MAFSLEIKMLPARISFVRMPVKTTLKKIGLILYTERKPTTLRLYGCETPISHYLPITTTYKKQLRKVYTLSCLLQFFVVCSFSS